MAVAVEVFNELPNRLLYGANYRMRSYIEIEEVLAFKDIRREEREAEEENGDDSYGPVNYNNG